MKRGWYSTIVPTRSNSSPIFHDLKYDPWIFQSHWEFTSSIHSLKLIAEVSLPGILKVHGTLSLLGIEIICHYTHLPPVKVYSDCSPSDKEATEYHQQHMKLKASQKIISRESNRA